MVRFRLLAFAIGVGGCALFPSVGDLGAAGTFAVGGSVDGLEGASATLTLNATTSMTVGDGAFAFPRGLADGASYDVAVTSSPPGHVCAVQLGSGVVAGADVTSIAVHCPSTTAVLSGLSLSMGPLTPTFDPAKLTYQAGPVDSQLLAPASTTVTATTADPGATLTIAGASATSGQPSAPVSLGPSPTNIDVTVTAPDHATQVHYVVTASTATHVDYVKASNTRASSQFGASVALDGDTLAVGTVLESSGATGIGGDQSDTSAPGAGAVYVYVRSNGVWAQQAYIKASNARTNGYFGRSVALSGDTLVVGSDGDSSKATGVGGDQTDTSAPGKGAVYVFNRTGTVWKQTAYLKPSNGGGRFGAAVALFGSTLAVGAVTEPSNARGIDGDQSNTATPYAGAVYVFVQSTSGVWSQQAYVKASNTLAVYGPDAGIFGCSVSLSGDTMVVGAYHEGSAASGVDGDQTSNASPGAGAAYVFTRAGTTWSQQAYLKPSNTSTTDPAWFGWSVALDGDTLAVGAEEEDSSGIGVNANQGDESAPSAGAVYLFVRTGTTWAQQAYIKPSNTLTQQQFGHSLALHGDVLVVGANEESSSGVGIDGEQNDTASYAAGAAYLFERSGTTWSQAAYIKAPNSHANWDFGASLSLSGTSLAIGALGESSAAKGINGDESDTSANAAGAVYVY